MTPARRFARPELSWEPRWSDVPWPLEGVWDLDFGVFDQADVRTSAGRLVGGCIDVTVAAGRRERC